MLATLHSAAQADFGGIELQPGDIVYVTEPSGIKVAGRVSRLSPSVLAIQQYEFTPMAGLKIERRGDPIWDGAVQGAIVGLGLGFLTASGECGVDWPKWKCTLAGAGWLGAIGTLVDWLHVGRTQIYLGTGPSVPTKSRAGFERTPPAELVSARVHVAF
jgi:hypothetical protein